MAIAVLAILCGAAVPSRAVDVPTPWWMSHLRNDLAGEPRVRVLGASRVLMLDRPQVDSAGVHAAEPISWSEIERIQRGRSAAGRGALYGGAAGALLAIGYHVLLNDATEEDTPLVPALVITGGATLGAMIGSIGTTWRTIYPPADLPMARRIKR
ncbi:MAG TPA: hypothetical protein VEY91_10375 [Candidatus Limnocylindria bacterium]|nr:hypothetical protein [Candidatus Limnocylindria bacterium]